ncbi:MAG TPA: hypothetical protein VD929_05960 [Caulobacteraceae bacterium]|nr:hypothetical protein [Caulobacteraceae bacterium]
MASSLCLVMAACATGEPAPYARPLSQASIEAMGPTPVSVNGDENGVAKAWFYTEVNGAGAGLIGAVAGAIAAAIINAGPSARAHKQADEVADVQTVEGLNASLVSTVKSEAARAPTGTGVSFPDVLVAYKAAPSVTDDAVEITTAYTLSEDSSVLRIVATATYANKALPYKTPYTFKKAPPKSETQGPLYRNTFTYYSTPLPVPTLTPELRERLIANIKESARDANGALPAEGTSEYRSMQREIELANDNKLTANETSLFLTRGWLSNDGARIKEEIRRAHEFVARYLLADMNRTAVPSLTGQDELLETAADQRTVRRIGRGVEAGSYVCSAPDVMGFATYGNAIAVSKRTVAYVKDMKAKAPKPAKASGRKS